MNKMLLDGARAKLVTRLLVACLLLGGVATCAMGASVSSDTLIVLNCEDTDSMRQVIAVVEAAGGAIRHVFPTHVLIGSASAELATGLAADPHVDLVCSGPVDASSIPAAYGRAARDAVSAWNDVFVAQAHLVDGAPDEIPWEFFEAPPRLAPDVLRGGIGHPEVAGAPPGAAEWQTSDYMMGSVVVSLMFVESDGAIDPQTRNWTRDREAQVVAQVLAGLDWWASQYPYSVAPISFTWICNYGMETGYEPITRPMTDENLWITEVMAALGYPGTPGIYLDTVRTYDNDLRDHHDTDWAFTIFLVDSSDDPDGRFADGWWAYAWVPGPFLVLPSECGTMGEWFLHVVCAHEVGHIFWAADEYGGSDPEAYSGYLNIQNTNAGTGVDCIMNNNRAAVCSVTQQQVGWRDSDSDGVPDILDVGPTASLDAYSPDPTSDTTPTYTGSAAVGYYPNQVYAGQDVTLNKIADIEYRVDAGAWHDAIPTDGAFDGGTEGYIFTPSALSYGTHTFEVRAIDTGGSVVASSPSDTLTLAPGHAVSVTASANPTTVASRGATALTASASDSEGHAVSSWWWDDGGVGGVFSPSANAQNPTYLAPGNFTGHDRGVTVTVLATCDDASPVGDAAVLLLTVQPGNVAELVSADLPASMEWDREASASLTYRNLGSDTWTAARGYWLVVADDVDRWGRESVGLDADVAPDQDHVFGFDIVGPPLTTLAYTPPVAPTAPGLADDLACAWRMARGTMSLPADEASQQTVVSRFPDIQPGTDGAWARFYVEECAGRVPRIVGGYDDGTYRPLVPVDRAAMAVYMARTLKLPTAPYDGFFGDVPSSHWAAQEIEALYRTGYARGFDNDTYRPSLVVTRDAMAVYVARGMYGGIDVPTGPAEATFPDVPTDHWAYDEVEHAVAHDVVQGYDNGTYRPDNPVDRGQMAVYVYRAFIQPTDTPVVLGGPAMTSVDPTSVAYQGWSSVTSSPVCLAPYAYVVFDAMRFGPSLVYPSTPSGTWDVKFELRRADDPETPATGKYTTTVSFAPDEMTAAKDAATASGIPYHVVSWHVPPGLDTGVWSWPVGPGAGLSQGDYLLVVSVGDGTGAMEEIARRADFTVTRSRHEDFGSCAFCE